MPEPYRVPQPRTLEEGFDPRAYGAQATPRATPQPAARGGLAQWFMPRAQQFGQRLGAAFQLGETAKIMEPRQKAAQEQISHLIERARREPDPTKKRRLIEIAQRGADMARAPLTEAFLLAEMEGITPDMPSWGRQAAGVVGEAATFLPMPTGIAAGTGRLAARAGAPLGIAAPGAARTLLAGGGGRAALGAFGKAVGAGAARGAYTGTIMGLTEPEAEGLGERAGAVAERGAGGALMGAALAGVGEIARLGVEGARGLARNMSTAIMTNVLRPAAGEKGDKFIQGVLKKDIPRSYKGMMNWSEKTSRGLTKKINKLDGPRISMNELLAGPDELGDRVRLEQIAKTEGPSTVDFLKKYANRFSKQQNFKDARFLKKVVNIWEKGDSISYQDFNVFRKIMNREWNATPPDLQKGIRAAAVNRLSNLARNIFRNHPQAPSEAASYLDSQHFAFTLYPLAVRAAGRELPRKMPSWWETQSVVVPTMFSRTEVGGTNLVAILLARTLTSPKGAALTQWLGQPRPGLERPLGGLAEWFTRQQIREQE